MCRFEGAQKKGKKKYLSEFSREVEPRERWILRNRYWTSLKSYEIGQQVKTKAL